MIGDEVIQAAIIAKLKELAPFGRVTSEEIREVEWQGASFSYPNIRVDLEENDFSLDEQGNCSALQYVDFSIYVFSEERSSKECSQIKTEIQNALIGVGFSNTSLGVKFMNIRMVKGGNVPAIRQDARTWRSQVKLTSLVSRVN